MYTKTQRQMELQKNLLKFKITFTDEELAAHVESFLKYMKKRVPLEKVRKKRVIFVGEQPIDGKLAKFIADKHSEKDGTFSITVAISPYLEKSMHKHFAKFCEKNNTITPKTE